jgi:mannitol/fructose-specific phosphotransferase system IIA component (Ntr-type)
MAIEAYAADTKLISLAHYTGPDLIVPRLRAQDKTALIQELSQLLERAARIPNLLAFYHAALNYEYFQNTASDAGFAFPHARAGNLPQLSFALGRSTEPVFWGPHAAHPVRVVVLLAVPEAGIADYLRLMSGFSRLVKDTAAVERLVRARDTFEVLSVLEGIKLRVRTAPSS